MAHSCALCGPRASRGSDQRHGQFALILGLKNCVRKFCFRVHGANILMKDGELFMDHPTPKPLSFKTATNKHSGEKVHLHQLSRELEVPLPDFLAPLVEVARKLEFNVTFL